MHYYDENSKVCSSELVFEEFDPNIDDPYNPRASVRMLQSAGCLTLVTALVIAAGIGGCYSIVKNHESEKAKVSPVEQRVEPSVVVSAQDRDDATPQPPQKVAPFVQRVDSYSGVIKQYGE